MKKIITVSILAAMLAAALTSCGQVDEPGTAYSGSSEAAAAAESDISDETDDESEEHSETTAPEDESEPEEITETTTVTSEPERPEPQVEGSIGKHEWLLQTISFDSYFGDYRFHQLANMGLANAYNEGMAYVIVPDSGGAGHAYYHVYYTVDGGESWSEGEFYDEINGDNEHFALEDGGIMLFSLHSARAESYPIVTYLYFEDGAIKSLELKEILAQTVLSDGRLLFETEGLDYEINYRYDHVFAITITDGESGEVLRDDEFNFGHAIEYQLNDQ